MSMKVHIHAYKTIREPQSVVVEEVVTFTVFLIFSLNADQMFSCSLSLLAELESSQGTYRWI